MVYKKTAVEVSMAGYTHKGNFVEGYYMVALLSRYFLNRYKGETIIHDPRVYWSVQKVCKELGGISVE